jgi:hypothetical protein
MREGYDFAVAALPVFPPDIATAMSVFHPLIAKSANIMLLEGHSFQECPFAHIARPGK